MLFGDGVFVGPDTRREFDQIEAKIRAASDLMAVLNRKLDDGEDVFAHAEQCASIIKAQIEAHPLTWLSLTACTPGQKIDGEECQYAPAEVWRAGDYRVDPDKREISDSASQAVGQDQEIGEPQTPTSRSTGTNTG